MIIYYEDIADMISKCNTYEKRRMELKKYFYNEKTNKLHIFKLYDGGAITQEEYEAKKSQLLGL